MGSTVFSRGSQGSDGTLPLARLCTNRLHTPAFWKERQSPFLRSTLLVGKFLLNLTFVFKKYIRKNVLDEELSARSEEIFYRGTDMENVIIGGIVVVALLWILTQARRRIKGGGCGCGCSGCSKPTTRKLTLQDEKETGGCNCGQNTMRE